MKKATVCRCGESDAKYKKYRIPGIVVTNRDTVIVYLEARADGSDWSSIDIVMLRSPRGSLSFSDMTVLVSGINIGKTVNNPVMISSSDGTLHFIYCVEYGINGNGIFYRKSTDDGISWSEAVNISDSTVPEYRNAFATGPGHGIALSDGTLAVPVWLVPSSAGREATSHHPAEVRMLYSKDNGQSWHITEKIPQGSIYDPNETAAAELKDGGVILNIRVADADSRAVSFCSDLTGEWSEMRFDKTLPDPECFGSMAVYSVGDRPYTILFSNCENRHLRKNLTVKGSVDGGKTWSLRAVAESGLAGYSDIAVSGSGLIYVLYEANDCQEIRLVTLDYDELKHYEPR